MKQIILLFAALVVLFSACEDPLYYADDPISDSKRSTIDTMLYGTWGLIEDSEAVVVLIIPLNDREYFIHYNEYQVFNDDLEPGVFGVLHSSTLAGETYYNLRYLGADSLYHSFWKLKADKDSLSISHIDKKRVPEQLTNSKQLWKELKKNPVMRDTVFTLWGTVGRLSHEGLKYGYKLDK